MNETSQPLARIPQRHEAFALHLALGATQVQAYKLSGFAAASPKGIQVNSTRLANRPEIIELVEKYRADKIIEAARVGLLTRDWVLDNLRLIVAAGKNEASKVRALELIGKELGLFIERSEVTRVDATQELDPTRLTWDELQTLLSLQRKARRPAPLVGQVVDTRALPADEPDLVPAQTLSPEPQD